MRDLLFCLAFFGTLPWVLRRPFLGVLLWTWLGLMNPHRYLWGFAAGLPFAQIVFVATVCGLFLSRTSWRLPWRMELLWLALFALWMACSTWNALYPPVAQVQWDKVWRILLGLLLTLLLTNSRERLVALTGVAALSLGFYGVKGGFFTLMGAGRGRVFGPPLSFIADNNDLGLALLMTLPLLWFFAQRGAQRWVRLGSWAAIALTLVAVVGTASRGALVGLLATTAFLLARSRQRLLALCCALLFAAVLPLVAPEAWFDRMASITQWEQDGSALGRLESWRNALDIANARITGGGYGYLPRVGKHDAHSIYFQVLGEHGWPGLLLFLALLATAWWRAGRVRALVRRQPDQAWAAELATLVQASLVAYLTAGAFLGLAYFDFFYLLVALLVQLHAELVRQRRATPVVAAPPARALPGTRPA